MPPASRRKTRSLDSKKAINYANDDELDQELESLAQAELEIEAEVPPTNVEPTVVVAPPKPIFETFSTKTKLQEGICAVRPLGGGKYEIVNLSVVELPRFGTEEIGALLKNTPALLNLLDVKDEDWNNVKLKAQQAVASSNGGLFRFLKLPIELRYRIYDFAIVTPHKLRHFLGNAWPPIGLNMRGTCKQIYDETKKFFFRNSFHLKASAKLNLLQEPILNNIQEAFFSWWGGVKDVQTFLMLHTQCPKLKVLNLEITNGMLDAAFEGPMYRNKRQVRYRGDVPEAKRFRDANGFDLLVELRGLERVNVTRCPNIPNSRLTKQEMDEFGDWLTKIVSQPKPAPKPRVEKPKAEGKSSRKSLKSNGKRISGKHLEDDGDDGAWRPGKKMK